MPLLPRYARRVPFPSTFAAVVLLAVAGCGDDGGSGPSQTVSLTPGTVSLFVGETRQLSATVSGTSNGSVSYGSSNDQVATVSQAGLVTAVGLGNATVTASLSGGQASGTATVTVNPSSVTATPAAVALEVGATSQLSATVQGGVGLNVSWSSADETVASVGDDGEVTGEGVGATTVTASVDGQPGVQAHVQVTVTAVSPDLVLESITTTAGEPIDPGSVSGVVVFTFTVSGPAGLAGEVDVLFGDQVAATAPVSLAEAVDGALAAPQADLTVPVVTVSAERIGDLATMKLPAGSIEVGSRLRIGTGTVPGRIRGSEGPTTILVVNGQRVAIVEPVNEPEPVVGTDGNAWTSGGLSLKGSLAWHPGLVGPTSVTLDLEFDGTPFQASAPVTGQTFQVDLSTLDPYPSLGNFAGRVTLVGIRDQDQATFPLANTYTQYPNAFSGFVAPGFIRKDNRGPVYAGPPFEVPASFWLGKGLDLTENFGQRASYDPGAWSDPGVGYYTCDWRAGFTPGTYSIADLFTSDDLPETSSTELFVARICRDAFGAETTLALGHPVGVDRTRPEVGWTTGSGYLDDLAVNPLAGVLFKPTGFDPVPTGLTGSSGIDPDRWSLSFSRQFPGVPPEAGCLTGLFQDGMCEKLPMPSPWIDGWQPDRSAGAGEYRIRYALEDLAGNRAHRRVRWIDDTTPPLVADIAYEDTTFVPGSAPHFWAQVTDNLEIRRASVALRYGGLDYAFLGESVELGTPYDGTFTNSVQVSARYRDYHEAVQTTSNVPPYGPTSTWYRATGALFGAQDTGGNVGYGYVDISHLTSAPTGTLTAVDGHYLEPGPSTLGVPKGGACTVPTEGTYRAEVFIPGNTANGPPFNILAARLYAVERLGLNGSTENATYPVTGWVEPEVHDFGSFRAGLFEALVNPSVGPMPEGDTEFFWHFQMPDHLRLQSQSFSVNIKYCF
jgi:hypothetical protein